MLRGDINISPYCSKEIKLSSLAPFLTHPLHQRDTRLTLLNQADTSLYVNAPAAVWAKFYHSLSLLLSAGRNVLEAEEQMWSTNHSPSGPEPVIATGLSQVKGMPSRLDDSGLFTLDGLTFVASRLNGSLVLPHESRMHTNTVLSQSKKHLQVKLVEVL